MTREMNQKKGQVVHDSNMFPQVLESEIEQVPRLPLVDSYFGNGNVVKVSRIFGSRFGDQTLLKFGPFYIVQNNLEKQNFKVGSHFQNNDCNTSYGHLKG